jgi:hypothetical protein
MGLTEESWDDLVKKEEKCRVKVAKQQDQIGVSNP